QGALNFEGDIENFLEDTENTPHLPATFGEGKFGEAAINLSGFFKEEKLGRCFSFGQLSMSSRSAESEESDLHDFVSPVSIEANDCPTIETSATSEVTVGEKIKDEATLKNLEKTEAGGKVTFTAYTNVKCEGEPLFGPNVVEV